MISRDTEQYREAAHRVKISHFTEQGLDINGVVHVGANDGYEVQWYQKLGIEHILCFEPFPPAVERFKQQYPDVACYQVALSDKNTSATLYQYGDDGAGSSLIQVKPKHPEVQRTWSEEHLKPIGKFNIDVRRFDTIIEGLTNYKAADYDCLVVDVQGHELKVLKGLGGYLRDFKFLNIECSRVPMYQGEASAQEVIEWLALAGFNQDSPVKDHNDIFFVRSDIIKEENPTMAYRGLA